jgi:hypothetical protein
VTSGSAALLEAVEAIEVDKETRRGFSTNNAASTVCVRRGEVGGLCVREEEAFWERQAG